MKFRTRMIHLKRTRRLLKKPQPIRRQPRKIKRRQKPKPKSLLSMNLSKRRRQKFQRMMTDTAGTIQSVGPPQELT